MNPFRYGQVVSSKDFCERKELKYLVDFIKSGQNVFIQGERRIGKTAHKNKPLAVVFDEFQDVLNIKDADEPLAVMRSNIQFQGNIPYCFAGSVRNKMADIFIKPENAFFKSATLLEVGLLDREKNPGCSKPNFHKRNQWV